MVCFLLAHCETHYFVSPNQKKNKNHQKVSISFIQKINNNQPSTLISVRKNVNNIIADPCCCFWAAFSALVADVVNWFLGVFRLPEYGT